MAHSLRKKEIVAEPISATTHLLHRSGSFDFFYVNGVGALVERACHLDVFSFVLFRLGLIVEFVGVVAGLQHEAALLLGNRTGKYSGAVGSGRRGVRGGRRFLVQDLPMAPVPGM